MQSPVKNYQLIAELGRGGMGTAYLAVVQGPAGFNKFQVIKCLRPLLAEEPEFLRMFLDEARLAARVEHPNVVQTNEVGFDGKNHFIAMEYLEGQSLEALSHRARDTGVFRLDIHLRIIADILGGLHAAHELRDFEGKPLNVVHRDMSPHNAIVTYEGAVKVVDFGIAKAADSADKTRSGVMKGKVGYMAVEQIGGGDVDRRTDVFAVGIILWQTLAQQRIWGKNEADILANLLVGNIPKPSSVKPEVDPRIEAICLKALGHKKEDRYATASDFQAAIEGFLADAGMRATAREIGA